MKRTNSEILGLYVCQFQSVMDDFPSRTLFIAFFAGNNQGEILRALSLVNRHLDESM